MNKNKQISMVLADLGTDISVDDIGNYFATGCIIHPLLYDYFLALLEEKECKNKVCLIPISIFHIYHKKLQKAA